MILAMIETLPTVRMSLLNLTDQTLTINMNVYETHSEKAEKLNGRLAMLGIVAALGVYALTGQIIPGIW